MNQSPNPLLQPYMHLRPLVLKAWPDLAILYVSNLKHQIKLDCVFLTSYIPKVEPINNL